MPATIASCRCGQSRPVVGGRKGLNTTTPWQLKAGVALTVVLLLAGLAWILTQPTEIPRGPALLGVVDATPPPPPKR